LREAQRRSKLTKQNQETLDDVVRVNYVLPDGRDFEACWPVLRKYFGKAKPAAMVITAGLLDPRMKIEIEVTAFKAL
jgi:enamine deaminase RidA (YjgF/YER057c/UK114 family)